MISLTLETNIIIHNRLLDRDADSPIFIYHDKTLSKLFDLEHLGDKKSFGCRDDGTHKDNL